MTDASGYADAGDTIEVPVSDWLAMHRRIGFAEGLLWGWFHAGDDVAQVRDATVKFLEKAP